MRRKIEYDYIGLERFERLLSVIPLKDRMYAIIFKIMRYRGIRSKHIIPLKLEHINQENKTLLIHDTKAKNYHSVMLPDFLWAELKEYLDQNSHRFVNGFVFCGITSKKDHIDTNTLTKKFREYFRIAGLQCDFTIDTNKKISNLGRKLHHTRMYDLRGSFGTDIQLATNDLYTTSVMLNHADLRSTTQYMRKSVLVKQHELVNKIFTMK